MEEELNEAQFELLVDSALFALWVLKIYENYEYDNHF